MVPALDKQKRDNEFLQQKSHQYHKLVTAMKVRSGVALHRLGSSIGQGGPMDLWTIHGLTWMSNLLRFLLYCTLTIQCVNSLVKNS